MRKFFSKVIFCIGGFFTFFVLFLFFYGFGLLIKDAYYGLQDYQFMVNIESKLIEKKRVELIDIFESNLKESSWGEKLFHFDKKSDDYEHFVSYISSLDNEKFENLFKDLWFAFGLPNDLDGGLTDSFWKYAKVKFVSQLFLKSGRFNHHRYKFPFNGEVSLKLHNDNNISNPWFEIIRKYQDKKQEIFYIEGRSSADDMGINEEEFDDKNDKHIVSYFIKRKLNLNFFIHSDDDTYSIIPSLMSFFLISIFIIVTILTLAIFTGIYLGVFVDGESFGFVQRVKKIFLKVLEFYQFLPEVVLVGLSFSFFIYTLKIRNNSILFFGINLFLIIFPILVNIVLRSLKLLAQNLKESLYMGESKVKFLIKDFLPLASPYLLFHAIRVMCYVSNFGILFLVAGNFSYLKITPYAFSDTGSSIIRDILLIDLFDQSHQYLIAPMLMVLIIINLVFYLFAFFIKRFVSIDINNV